MSKRLGDVLLAKGHIDDQQLAVALNSQLVLGGHLGTCLIEHRFLDERTLGETLGELFDCRYVEPHEFDSLPRDLIEVLPVELAEEHQAIPIRKNGQELEVAMLAPADSAAVGELAAAVGCSIRAAVAPEVRLFQALERYYSVPRRLRFVSLSRELDGGEQPPPPARRPASPTVPQEDLPPSPWLRERPPETDRFAVPRELAPSDEPPLESLDDVATALCHAVSGRDLAEIVVRFVARFGARAILFRVKGKTARPWAARGLPLDAKRRQATFSVVDEPLFGLVKGNAYFHGDLPPQAALRSTYARLGIVPPQELLLLPVHLNDRIVALLYGDAPQGTMPHKTTDYVRVMRKFRLAVELLLIKQKIAAS